MAKSELKLTMKIDFKISFWQAIKLILIGKALPDIEKILKELALTYSKTTKLKTKKIKCPNS